MGRNPYAVLREFDPYPLVAVDRVGKEQTQGQRAAGYQLLRASRLPLTAIAFAQS